MFSSSSTKSKSVPFSRPPLSKSSKATKSTSNSKYIFVITCILSKSNNESTSKTLDQENTGLVLHKKHFGRSSESLQHIDVATQSKPRFSPSKLSSLFRKRLSTSTTITSNFNFNSSTSLTSSSTTLVSTIYPEAGNLTVESFNEVFGNVYVCEVETKLEAGLERLSTSSFTTLSTSTPTSSIPFLNYSTSYSTLSTQCSSKTSFDSHSRQSSFTSISSVCSSSSDSNKSINSTSDYSNYSQLYITPYNTQFSYITSPFSNGKSFLNPNYKGIVTEDYFKKPQIDYCALICGDLEI